jgi:hypothetical protein
MSKLGFHISQGDQRGLGEALDRCAKRGHPVAVVFSVGQDLWPDIARYSPSTTYIFRTQKNHLGVSIGDGPQDVYHGDPVQSARGWMDQMMPVWEKNKAHFYAPLNEQDPAQIEGFTWLNAFSVECLNIAEAHGLKLGLYAFSGGNPKDVLQPASGQAFTRDDAWRALLPSLRRAKQGGHILLLHEYGFQAGTLRNSQPWLALRYRHVYRYLASENADANLVISEASANVGFTGDPALWLSDVKWYDSELLKDRAVIGCCLYQLGGKENFVSVLPQLTDYIAAMPTPLGQSSPVAPAPDRTVSGSPVDDSLRFLISPAPIGQAYRIVVDVLNIRALPDVNSARVGALTRGQIVRVTDQVVQPAYIWGKIDRGWIVLEPRLAPFAERLA